MRSLTKSLSHSTTAEGGFGGLLLAFPEGGERQEPPPPPRHPLSLTVGPLGVGLPCRKASPSQAVSNVSFHLLAGHLVLQGAQLGSRGCSKVESRGSVPPSSGPSRYDLPSRSPAGKNCPSHRRARSHAPTCSQR